MDFSFLHHDELSVAKDGMLTIAGHRANVLTKEYGTPLVVILEDVVRNNCREYQSRLRVYPRSRVYYASKALLTVGLAKLLAAEKMGVDVVSGGELLTAIAGGIDPELIMLHGNAKSADEIALAIDHRVGRIAVDNLAEIKRLGGIADDRGVVQKVFVRVTPGVKPETHKYVQTGQQDSKFGFNLAGGPAMEACRLIHEHPNLELVGLHCHIGSQILDLEPFSSAVLAMLNFYRMVQKTIGAPLDELNIGGGLGINYDESANAPTAQTHASHLAKTVLKLCDELEIEPPVLCDEPGRSIIGEAGLTLYEVQSVKQIPGVRNYASVDGGITDNPRYALYEARHPVLIANRAKDSADQQWCVSGKCCETGDMLIRDADLPAVQVGDLIAMLCTGAYTWSMASNYNRVARPAVILVNREQVGLLARRETPEETLRLDEIPEWL